jgi:hypothetical protein
MKKIYNNINSLVGKSGIGFTWSDDRGMEMTPETQPQLDKLCKVCIYLTRSSMTADRYQGKPQLSKYVRNGWPHFTAMQQLVTSITRGTHAHQGTQPVAECSAENALSSSRVPPPPKCGFSLLDNMLRPQQWP